MIPIIGVVLGKERYDPRPTLTRLETLAPEARVDVALDFLTGRGGGCDHRTYGKIDKKDRMRPGEEATIAEHRSARVCDIFFRPLHHSGPTLSPRIDRELGALLAGERAARRASGRVS